MNFPAGSAPGSITLEACLRQEASRRGITLPGRGSAPLAGLEYPLEIELKNRALRRFWQGQALPGRPEALLASPKPRHYRTTSKRRCRPNAAGARERGGPRQIFFEGEEAAALEPPEHRLIFAFLEERLARSEFRRLAQALHFVIIRGTYTEFMVIFNFQAMDREINRQLLQLVTRLRSLPVNIVSAFLYLDPGRSPYYLETDRPRAAFPIKRLFGPQCFRLAAGGITFSVPPTSFSQVNESLLPLLLASVHRAVAGGDSRGQPGGQRRLLDLYCGYGLFTHSLRGLYREIIAVDAAPDAVRAGRDMVPESGRPARVVFKVLTISRGSLDAALPPPLLPGEEDVILDPPRHGIDAASIRSIARRRPGLVLHLFCASEEIPGALKTWQQCGYFVRRVVPLDMFAGTPQLETLVQLTPH